MVNGLVAKPFGLNRSTEEKTVLHQYEYQDLLNHFRWSL